MARTKIFFYWTTGQRSCDAEADNSRNVIPLSLFPHSLGWSWKGRRRTRCCGAGGTSCSLQKRVQVAQICDTRFPEGAVLLQRLPDYLHSRHAATLLRRLSILWPCCTHEPWRLPLLWCLLNSSRCFFTWPSRQQQISPQRATLSSLEGWELAIYILYKRHLFSFERRQAEVLIHCVFTVWHFMC